MRRSRSCSKKHRDLLLFGPPAARKAAKARLAAVREEPDDDEEARRSRVPRTTAARVARPRSVRAATSRASIPNLRRRYDEGSWAVQEDLKPYPHACASVRLQRAVASGARASPCASRARRMAEYVNLPISEAAECCSTGSSSPSAKR